MQSKTEDSYVDRSLGFEVELRSAPMRLLRDEWVLDVGPQLLQRSVMWKLIVSSGPLTGDHVRFMRHALGETLESLASDLGVSAPAISKWQDKKDEATGMAKGTEALLRLHVCQSLLEDSEFDGWERQAIFYTVYERVSQFERARKPETVVLTATEIRRADSSPASLPFEVAGLLGDQASQRV